jgi:methionyl aminopeptidase
MSIRQSTVIKVLTPVEIEAMKKVCKMGREILDIGGNAIKVGVTTDEIDRLIHEATIERNAYPSPLNYNGFPKSCCTSVNEAICHGIPDQRPLQDGDILNIDVSVYFEGFHADLNETYLVGNVDEAGRKLVDSARECLAKAIETGRGSCLLWMHCGRLGGVV